MWLKGTTRIWAPRRVTPVSSAGEADAVFHHKYRAHLSFRLTSCGKEATVPASSPTVGETGTIWKRTAVLSKLGHDITDLYKMGIKQ